MSLLAVARVAGVSLSTVSRAINRPESLTTEKLVAVRDAITAMNYTPLPPEKRRGPKAGNSGQRKPSVTRIGLWCVGATENQAQNYYSSQLELLHFAVAESRMELKLVFSPPNEMPSELATGSVEGLILQGLQPDAEVLEHIAGFPHVWMMTRRSASWPGDYVEPDNVANGRLAADWLAARGARHWVFLSTEPGYPAFAQRKEAFLHRAKELGMTVAIVGGNSTQGEKHYASTPGDNEMDLLARQFLHLRPEVDGVYLPGDGVCGPFFRALRKQGGEPSGLQTILGHYNPQAYDSLDPQPAVIGINLRAIVRHAVTQLAERIRNPLQSPRTGIKVAPYLFLPKTTNPSAPIQ